MLASLLCLSVLALALVLFRASSRRPTLTLLSPRLRLRLLRRCLLVEWSLPLCTLACPLARWLRRLRSRRLPSPLLARSASLTRWALRTLPLALLPLALLPLALLPRATLGLPQASPSANASALTTSHRSRPRRRARDTERQVLAVPRTRRLPLRLRARFRFLFLEPASVRVWDLGLLLLHLLRPLLLRMNMTRKRTLMTIDQTTSLRANNHSFLIELRSQSQPLCHFRPLGPHLDPLRPQRHTRRPSP